MRDDPLGLYANDPLGLNEDDPLGLKKQRTTIGEDIKQGLAGAGKLLDTGVSLSAASLAGMFGGDQDAIFQGLDERKQSLDNWAGGQGKEKGISGAIISGIAGLPAAPLAPWSGLDRATELLKQGVSLKEAGLAGAADSALSTAGFALPVIGKTVAGKIASGALGNAAMGGASDAATQAIVSDPNVAAQFDPWNVERRVSEAALGGVAGPFIGKRANREIPHNLDLEAKPDTSPLVDPARADVVAQMDAQLRQQYVNQDLDSALQRPPMTLDDSRPGPRAGTQDPLPLSTKLDFPDPSVHPDQMKLFGDEQPPVHPEPAPKELTQFGTGERTGYTGVGKELFPELPKDIIVPERPSIETAVDKLANNQHFDMTATEKVAWDKAKGLVEQFDDAGAGKLSDRQIANKIMDRQWIQEAISKAKQVEAMYKDVEERAQTVQEKIAIRERLEAVEDQLNQLGEHLASKDHKVNLQGQGPKTRAAKEAQNPGFRTGIPKGQRGAVHGDLLGLGVTDEIVKLFRHLRNTELDGSGLETRGEKAANTRARNAYFKALEDAGLNPQTTHAAISRIADTQGLGALGTPSVPKGQRGAVNFGSGKLPGHDIIANLTQDAIVGAKLWYENSKKRTAMAKSAGLDAYKTILDTPEKVFAALENKPDISNAELMRGRTVTPGINVMSINTGHPFLLFNRNRRKAAQLEMDNLAREHISDPKTGLKSILFDMKQPEKNAAHAILMKGDKDGKFMTRADMEAMGATENTIRFVEKLYEVDKIKLDIWNRVRKDVGLDEVVQRPGHYPGVFRGDYKTVVHKDVKDPKTGEVSRQVIGLINTDNKWHNMYVKSKLKKEYAKKGEQLIFSEMDRRHLGGNGQRSDLFSGVGDLINTLGRNNPDIAKIQELVRAGVVENADALFGAHLHSLNKKGVFGNEGNKSWKTNTQNANDAIDAYLRYWEEGVASHLNIPIEAELKAMMDNPMLDSHENAKKYVNEYNRNATGRNLGKFGDSLNGVIDGAAALIGFGPSLPRGTINQVNKRAGQWAMGAFNFAFSAVQFTQVLQTALPEMQRVANLAGVSQADPVKAMGKTLAQTVDIFKAHRGLANDLSPTMRQAVKEAEKRGINQFSEFQDVNSMTQSKASRTFDKTMDMSRSIPENMTRSYVFYSLVNMLEGKVPHDQLFEIAYNATQKGMFDYSMAERPQMYQRLGTIGQMAGSLQTFKHNFLSQRASMRKDMVNGLKEGSVKEAVPYLTSTIALLSFAGVMGVPFYHEVDELVKKLTSMFGKQQNIEQIVLKNLPQWIKRGAVSDATNLDIQGRLSAAKVLPENLPEAISPYAGMIGDIGARAGEVADIPDNPQNWKNLGISLAPNSVKKTLEDDYKKRDNAIMNNKGEKGNTLTQEQQDIRRWGMNPLDVSVKQQQQWVQTQKAQREQEKLSGITTNMKKDIETGNWNQARARYYVDKYKEAGGTNIKAFVETMKQEALVREQDKQQRLEGIPKSVEGVKRYKNFNEY